MTMNRGASSVIHLFVVTCVGLTACSSVPETPGNAVIDWAVNVQLHKVAEASQRLCPQLRAGDSDNGPLKRLNEVADRGDLRLEWDYDTEFTQSDKATVEGILTLQPSEGGGREVWNFAMEKRGGSWCIRDVAKAEPVGSAEGGSSSTAAPSTSTTISSASTISPASTLPPTGSSSVTDPATQYDDDHQIVMAEFARPKTQATTLPRRSVESRAPGGRARRPVGHHRRAPPS